MSDILLQACIIVSLYGLLKVPIYGEENCQDTYVAMVKH